MTSIDLASVSVSGDRDAPAANPTPAPGRRMLNCLRSVLTTVFGLAGALAVLWLVLSMVFDLTVVIFRTGSMSPVAPQGAAAIMEQVDAADLRIGDVVTVSRGGRLPVTHRIIAIDPVAGDPDARSLTLKGDANAQPDSDPAVVTSVRRMVVAAPYVGAALVFLQRPTTLLILGVVVAGLVAWAFWPQPISTAQALHREQGPRHRSGYRARHATSVAARMERRG